MKLITLREYEQALAALPDVNTHPANTVNVMVEQDGEPMGVEFEKWMDILDPSRGVWWKLTAEHKVI